MTIGMAHSTLELWPMLSSLYQESRLIFFSSCLNHCQLNPIWNGHFTIISMPKWSQRPLKINKMRLITWLGHSSTEEWLKIRIITIYRYLLLVVCLFIFFKGYNTSSLVWQHVRIGWNDPGRFEDNEMYCDWRWSRRFSIEFGNDCSLLLHPGLF